MTFQDIIISKYQTIPLTAEVYRFMLFIFRAAKKKRMRNAS